MRTLVKDLSTGIVTICENGESVEVDVKRLARGDTFGQLALTRKLAVVGTIESIRGVCGD